MLVQRDVICIIVLVSIFILSGTFLGAVTSQDADDWNQLANDSRHTGYNPNVEDVRENPQIKWKTGTNFIVGHQPVTDGDRVYYWDRGSPAILARNATTGELIWRDTDITSLPKSAPAVSENLYVALETGLQAYNKSTGRRLWSNNISGTTITTYDNTIYLSTKNRIYAVNSDSGDILWERNVSSVSRQRTISVSDGVVYVPSNGSIILVDGRTGVITDEYDVQNSSGTLYGVVVNDDAIYSLSTDGVYALDASEGDLLWTHRSGSLLSAVTDERVYVNGRDRLVALDARTGDIEWRSVSPRSGSVAVGNRTVYLNSGGELGGKVYALDARTGDILWEFGISVRTGDNLLGASATPSIGDGVVYAPGVSVDGDGREFYVLSKNGTPLSRSGSDSSPASVSTAVLGLVSVLAMLMAVFVYRQT